MEAGDLEHHAESRNAFMCKRAVQRVGTGWNSIVGKSRQGKEGGGRGCGVPIPDGAVQLTGGSRDLALSPGVYLQG